MSRKFEVQYHCYSGWVTRSVLLLLQNCCSRTLPQDKTRCSQHTNLFTQHPQGTQHQCQCCLFRTASTAPLLTAARPLSVRARRSGHRPAKGSGFRNSRQQWSNRDRIQQRYLLLLHDTLLLQARLNASTSTTLCAHLVRYASLWCRRRWQQPGSKAMAASADKSHPAQLSGCCC